MNTAKKALVLGLSLILLTPMLLMAKTSGKKKKIPAKATITLENLKKAYNREMNAQTRYLAYAGKAKSEGYSKVAKLFRAIAKSESIHAAGQAKIIKSMGRKPAAGKGKPKVGTTKKNLYTAINEITYTMLATYPDFIKQAETDKNENAAKSFTREKAVEDNQKKLLVEAAANLEEVNADSDFFICKICGNVVGKLDFENCPVCNAPVSEFEKVK